MYEQLTIFDIGKTCTSCLQYLPYSAFCRHKQKKDGLNSRCKRCSVADSRRSRQKNPERTQVTDRARRERLRKNNPEGYARKLSKQRQKRANERREREKEWQAWLNRGLQRCKACGVEKSFDCFYASSESKSGIQTQCIDCGKAYYVANKEWINECQRRYNAQHAEWIRERSRRYRAENAEWLSRLKKEYREQNLEACREKDRQWRKNNPLKEAQNNLKKLARKKNATVGHVDLAAILQTYGMVCHICNGEILKRDDLHFDHVIPLSKGGEHSMANIKPSHAWCNMSKGNRVLE